MQHVRIAKYRVTSGTLAEISDAAQEGMLKVFKEQPGFISYGVADSGGGTLLSISHWETHDEAEEAAVAARGWVAENLADRIELLENNTGDYLFLG
jgi:heme-degrading monooxygenase HmoA